MTPYTMDAVAAIRDALRQSTPPQFIREKLGWDVTMFERVCRRHGIEIVIAPIAPLPAPEPISAAMAETFIARAPSPLEVARSEKKIITRALRMVWRTALVSRRAWRCADLHCKSCGVPLAEGLSRIIERAISDGSANTVYILQRGDIRRDVNCNVRLVPGIDQRLIDICNERKCKPTQLIASILEARFRDVIIGA